jgi:hypothetical protein
MGWAAKGLERRIRSEGLLQPDDRLIAVEVGDLMSWWSNGQPRYANKLNMAIGYGNRGLAIVGQEWVTGVDLLMVRQVEVLDEETSRPTLKITFIDDRDGSMTDVMWRPQMRRKARQFADSVLGSARRRQQDLPAEAANVVAAWEQELARRELEAERLRKEPGDRQMKHVAGFRIGVETLAFEVGQVPTESAFSTRGSLLLLNDGRIAAFAGDILIARFETADVDYVSIPGPLGIDDGPTGPWEIGYTTRVGVRRLLFSGPGLALFPGQLQESADPFLNESGLMDLDVIGKGMSWRPKAAAD